MKKMKALMIILGVVLLSGTDALAANLNRVNGGMQAFAENSRLNCTSSDVPSTQTNTGNLTPTPHKPSNHLELKDKSRLMIGGFAPEDRGNPGDRGNPPPPKSGGSR
jgi:hypothetical protein